MKNVYTRILNDEVERNGEFGMGYVIKERGGGIGVLGNLECCLSYTNPNPIMHHADVFKNIIHYAKLQL